MIIEKHNCFKDDSLNVPHFLYALDSGRQVEYEFKIKASGLSVMLKEGNSKEETMMVHPGTRDKKSLVSWLSESVTVHADFSRGDRIEAVFSDIGISMQVNIRITECSEANSLSLYGLHMIKFCSFRFLRSVCSLN